MSQAAILYPELAKEEAEDSSFYGPGDYQPILNSFGEIIIQVDDNDYQGDSRVLYKDGDRYGMLIFGWGSCSGCDALQACSNLADIDELISELRQKIMWLPKDEMLQYMLNHDWEGDYTWGDDETKEFVSKVIEILKENNHA